MFCLSNCQNLKKKKWSLINSHLDHFSHDNIFSSFFFSNSFSTCQQLPTFIYQPISFNKCFVFLPSIRYKGRLLDYKCEKGTSCIFRGLTT